MTAGVAAGVTCWGTPAARAGGASGAERCPKSRGRWAKGGYEAWLQEQITAGKNYNSSGLDLRSPGQKMDNIKKSVQQNDKIQGLIQPPKGL